MLKFCIKKNVNCVSKSNLRIYNFMWPGVMIGGKIGSGDHLGWSTPGLNGYLLLLRFLKYEWYNIGTAGLSTNID